MAPITLQGQTLGKYRILEPLGQGGMAQVYRAYHAQLDRYVAVKVLRSDLVEEQEFLARFSREARSVAALRHPNIVQVFDFDVQDGLYYMVMELLEGDTLKAYLNKFRGCGQTVPAGEIAHILTDVLKGLAYAHSEGIIHRDVKPANILLTRRGEAVITDFGIAQIVGGTQYTVSGALMGTLHYMAPEQALGKNVDGRSDVYSLGVVLYEMLTGQPPFDADTPLAILMKHLNDPLPLPQEPGRAIAKPFERVVLKALAKQPEDRYQTAVDMMQAIQEAAAACAGENASQTVVTPNATGTGSASTGDASIGDASIGDESTGDASIRAVHGELFEATEPPQVFSGTEREHITDKGFAADKTDFNLEQHLQSEALQTGSSQKKSGEQEVKALTPTAAPANTSDALGEVVQAATNLFVSVGGVVSTALNTAAQEVKQGAETSLKTGGVDETDSDISRIAPHNAGKAALLGAGILVGANLLAVGIGTATSWWGLFQYGWPAELLLVAILLSLVMSALSEIWILIPAGILMGNGLLLSYFSLSGNWRLWGLLWPLEPALIAGTIILATNLARRSQGPVKSLARAFGFAMAMTSGLGLLMIGVGSALVSAFRALLP